jgi:hypothetical protein
MDKKLKKALEAHLETLETIQSELFDIGHTFWFCDAEDESHKKPFYYYQINRTRKMATCSICNSLIRNRKRIRAIQKELGIELTPLYTNFKEEKHIKRLSVRGGGNPGFNPNLSYVGFS